MRFAHLVNKNKRKAKRGKQNKVKTKPCIEEGMYLLAIRLEKEDYDDNTNVDKMYTPSK